jgi:ribosomal protein L40E
MTEILTESFCERCGTRYTFESTAPRRRRLRGVKVLSRGLRNFVMSDDTSIDEAFAAARSDAERELTALQLDAFHATFNFCMSCRQYTCATCWNGPELRCLSCAPLEVPTGDITAVGEIPTGPQVEAVDWPSEPRIEAATSSAPTPGVGDMAAGQDLDDAIAAYEASLASEAAERVEVAEAATAEPQAVATPEAPEAVETALVPAEPPETTEPAAPSPVPPSWPTGPRWPTAIPARQPRPGSEPAASPASPPIADSLAALIARTSTDAMRKTIGRDVTAAFAAPQVPTMAVKSCGKCGISLSATARFCRRCGTAQG